ncbi:MAG: hypothetical protein MUE90_04390 [Thermoanaerobaculales bacterium]|nr:hypothetical protein [Thermoanaerobaculales bacterium]
MTAPARVAVALAVTWLAAVPSAADVVFPARLEVVETDPGQFSVAFTLPAVEGRVLRATAVMPPGCRDLTERERASTFGGVTTSWSVRCEPASLAGEAIVVEGLLGTQIELAFNLTTLDGRAFSEILKPSRPGFLVPHPPSAAALAVEAGGAGLRWALGRSPLWLLIVVVGLGGARWRDLGQGIVAFAAAAAIAHWLVTQGLLHVAQPVADSFVLLTAAVPAVRLAGGGERWQGWVRPLWPAMLLVGTLLGGVGEGAAPAEGLSRGERLAALALFAVGTAAALTWAAAVAVELRTVLVRVADGRWRESATRVLATLLGGLATGMVLARVVALVLLAESFPLRALSPVVAAVVLAPLLVAAGGNRCWTVPAFVVLAGLGLALGLARYALPLSDLLVPAVLLAVGLVLTSGRSAPEPWAMATAACAAVACSWSGTLALVDNVSRSTAAAVATGTVATAALFVGLAVWRPAQPGAAPVPMRVAGLALVSGVGLGRLAATWSWVERDVATAASLGLLRVPLAASVLLGLAAMLWPRRRRVLDELGVVRRQPVWHWAALAAALLAVPYGTLAVRNPFHEPRAPRGDDARRVASRVLSDTYHAFNLSDEGEVFDRLADSVTGDLVEDVYLDSRRRLSAGTRQGTEVTVRDVSVVDIGDPVERTAGSGDFAYDCRWVVISRVRHLQHIHHRQNIYGGVLTLTVDGDRWKISRVELASEDRVLLSAPST